jgi:hypothetical protein
VQALRLLLDSTLAADTNLVMSPVAVKRQADPRVASERIVPMMSDLVG